MNTTRRNFLKISGVLAILPALSKIDIISEFSHKIKYIKPQSSPFKNINVRFLGRRKVFNHSCVDESNQYIADVYNLRRSVKGEMIECYAFLDAELVDLVPDKKKFIKYELVSYAESINIAVKNRFGI